MEFHYVVIYNSDTKKWCVSSDTEGYFPDGHVWDDKRDIEDGYGWFYPFDDEFPEVAALDQRAYIMLTTLASIWPEVYDGD